jgi:sulfur carrier protein
MIVKINGEETDVAEDITIQKLVLERKLNQRTIIVELNGLVLKPDLWRYTILNPNDKLEIVRILGGG